MILVFMYSPTHIVVGSTELFNSESSYSRVHCTRPKELKCIISIDFCPHGQQLFYRLLDLERISPSNRFKEFREAPLISSQVKSEFPNYILFL